MSLSIASQGGLCLFVGFVHHAFNNPSNGRVYHQEAFEFGRGKLNAISSPTVRRIFFSADQKF